MDDKKLGKFGEDIACRYLENKGYKILERNYTKELSAVQKGEIDIVARKDEIVCFIEVKTSREQLSGSFFPEDRVNFQKQQKLKRLSRIWLSEKKIPLNSPWQIDVISIRINPQIKKAKVRHFKNAVS